jgi:hypothetical protein
MYTALILNILRKHGSQLWCVNKYAPSYKRITTILLLFWRDVMLMVQMIRCKTCRANLERYGFGSVGGGALRSSDWTGQ